MGRRIVLTTVGSYGDLHPFLAVALELKARGLEPVIATSEAYRGKVEGEGIAFHPVRPTPSQLLDDSGLDEAALARSVARGGATRVVELAVLPYLDESYADLSEAMQGADAVLASSFSLVARVAARKAGLPAMSLLLSPLTFFSAQDPPLLMELPWLQGLRWILGARGVSFVLDLGRRVSRRQTRPINELRRRLGLPDVAGDEILDGPLRAERIVALYSPVLGPLPLDAPPGSSIAGFTFYDSEAGGQMALAPELSAFLEGGPAPLVFTLGSFAVLAADGFYEAAALAATRLGRRAVLLVGREADRRLARLASPDIHVAGYAPHSLVFPRAEAIVHHGGIGTVAQALRAGRPQLVCPLFGDQADNAQRLERLGVARTLRHRRFMARTIEALLADEGITVRAAALGHEVAGEDGAAFVYDAVADMISSTASP